MVNGLPRVGWVVNGLLWVGGEWSTWGRMGVNALLTEKKLGVRW